MNKKTFLKLTILNAKFEIDVDEDKLFLGKQDPFFKFKYLSNWFQTEVKDEAGRNAEWNESFILDEFR